MKTDYTKNPHWESTVEFVTKVLRDIFKQNPTDQTIHEVAVKVIKGLPK